VDSKGDSGEIKRCRRGRQCTFSWPCLLYSLWRKQILDCTICNFGPHAHPACPFWPIINPPHTLRPLNVCTVVGEFVGQTFCAASATVDDVPLFLFSFFCSFTHFVRQKEVRGKGVFNLDQGQPKRNTFKS